MSRPNLAVSALLVIAFAVPRAWSGEKKPIPPPEALKAADERIEKDLKEAFGGPAEDLLDSLLKYAEEHAKEPALQFESLNICLQRAVTWDATIPLYNAASAMGRSFAVNQYDLLLAMMAEREKQLAARPNEASGRNLERVYRFVLQFATREEYFDAAEEALTHVSKHRPSAKGHPNTG